MLGLARRPAPSNITVELIEEDKAAEFSERFARMIQEHEAYQANRE
jgi:hypothetical protein